LLFTSMQRVFVDGRHGTAGSSLAGLLRRHPAIELLELPLAQRRDAIRRRDATASPATTSRR
jgi:N-acetyl-gamma-glutamylphosphate reductase